jgi:hypothetical protein
MNWLIQAPSWNSWRITQQSHVAGVTTNDSRRWDVQGSLRLGCVINLCYFAPESHLFVLQSESFWMRVIILELWRINENVNVVKAIPQQLREFLMWFGWQCPTLIFIVEAQRRGRATIFACSWWYLIVISMSRCFFDHCKPLCERNGCGSRLRLIDQFHLSQLPIILNADSQLLIGNESMMIECDHSVHLSCIFQI